MQKSCHVLLICLALTSVRAQDAGASKGPFLSPDKQWEYRYSETIGAGIVEAGTTQIVLDLSDDTPRPEEATVVWSPDSKRFAFTYSPPHAPHTTYETTTLYQLSGGKWVPLAPLVEPSSNRAQVAQLARDHVPKNPRQRHIWASPATRDILRVRQWPDASTAILYARAAWDKDGRDQGAASFLFTLHFDVQGKWKIVKAHEMSEKEMATDEKN